MSVDLLLLILLLTIRCEPRNVFETVWIEIFQPRSHFIAFISRQPPEAVTCPPLAFGSQGCLIDWCCSHDPVLLEIDGREKSCTAFCYHDEKWQSSGVLINAGRRKRDEEEGDADDRGL
jgi:hypothetical protein